MVEMFPEEGFVSDFPLNLQPVLLGQESSDDFDGHISSSIQALIDIGESTTIDSVCVRACLRYSAKDEGGWKNAGFATHFSNPRLAEGYDGLWV